MPSAKQNGADLVLRELTTGITQNIGNVNLYDFDDAGRMLAYTVDAADRTGNGVYVIDLATSQSKVLSSASLDYDQLTWGDKGEALAVLRGDKKKENLAARQHAARLEGRRAAQRRRRSNTIRRRTRASRRRWS